MLASIYRTYWNRKCRPLWQPSFVRSDGNSRFVRLVCGAMKAKVKWSGFFVRQFSMVRGYFGIDFTISAQLCWLCISRSGVTKRKYRYIYSLIVFLNIYSNLLCRFIEISGTFSYSNEPSCLYISTANVNDTRRTRASRQGYGVQKNIANQFRWKWWIVSRWFLQFLLLVNINDYICSWMVAKLKREC